nr:uncharacterized protein LOC109148764 isoform X2 [Ipomoea batatas]
MRRREGESFEVGKASGLLHAVEETSSSRFIRLPALFLFSLIFLITDMYSCISSLGVLSGKKMSKGKSGTVAKALLGSLCEPPAQMCLGLMITLWVAWLIFWSSSQQPNPSSQPIPESPQAIPESQPIPDSALENPFDEIHEGNDFVYNDETENAFVEVEVGDGESDNPENLPDESDNPENSSHEVQLGDEMVQLVQVPFLRESKTNQVRKAAREERAIQQPPTSKKQKTLGLKRQVKTKHVATRTYRTRSTVVFKSKFKGNLSEPIELD